MNEKQMLFSYDRRRTSTLTVDEQPGAHTGSTRKYIPGYSDSNIVYRDTVSGNDSNSGATELLPKLTQSSAETAAGTTKKIRVINDGAVLSTSITKPTEMKRGVSGTISSSSLTAPVNVWTQAGTLNGYSATSHGLVWLPWLSQFICIGGSSKLYYTSDLDTFTAIAGHGFGSSGPVCAAISQKRKIIFIAGSDGKLGSSLDGSSFSTSAIASVTQTISGMHYDDETDTLLLVGQNGLVARSVDQGATFGLQFLDLSPTFVQITKSLTRWVLASTDDRVFYSDNGVQWTQVATATLSALTSVFYSAVIGKFLIGTEDGDIYYSTDATAWTAAVTPSFGSDIVYEFSEDYETGIIIAVGSSGKIAYSTDGNVFTQSGTPSYGSSTVAAVAFSPLLQRFLTAGTGKAARSTEYVTTVSAHIAGFTLRAIKYSGTATAYNCSLRQPGTTAALSLDNCRVEYDSHISNNAATSRATLYRGDRHTTCTPAAQNDIDINLDTVGGTWYIHNASQTGFERIRDCLVVGGIVANYPVTVSGRSNVQGTSVNALFDEEVTHNDPKFVDETGYKLEFQTNGYSRNSFAAGRSNIYFNSAGGARDIGAWCYVESAVSYYFAKSEPIFKGTISHGLEFALNEQQGDSGAVSVYGNTRRVKEVITITYGTTYEREKQIFEYMLTLTDKTVKIQLDAEWTGNPGTVVANGTQAVDSEFLEVDAIPYYDGMWLTISDKAYFVMRASPNPQAATRLILDRPLEDEVTDNDVIPRNYPAGAGEYQFAGPVNLTLRRADPTVLQGYFQGFQIRLVRGKQ